VLCQEGWNCTKREWPSQQSNCIVLHLGRFADFFEARYGHERASKVLKRDVEAWVTRPSDDLALAPATVNSHLASLSKFLSPYR